MKKNSLLVLFILMTAAAEIFCETPYSKVSEYSNGVYFFDGYAFKEWDSSSHSSSLENWVDVEISDIRKKKKNSESKYAIVGYSEGGLRVLAYATRLYEQNPSEYKNLKAVITVSGIDKGLKALDGCSETNKFTPLKSRIQEDINIIYNGIGGFVVGMPATSAILGIFGGMVLLENKDDVYGCIEELTPVLNSYITSAWRGVDYTKLAELYDMMPKSQFIENNVSKTVSVTYKVKTGTKNVWKTESKKVLGIKITCPVLKKEDVYKAYTAYKDVPVFNPDLPVGYIVGVDSNTLGFLDDNTESSIRKGASFVSTAMYVAEGVNIAKCIASLGICSFYGTCANYCDKAGKWFGNIDEEINELKGLNENDGLVAKESQYYPMRFYNPDTNEYEEVHSNVLGDTTKGYVELDYNHMVIDPRSNEKTAEEIDSMLKGILK